MAFVARHALTVYAILAVGYLIVPIAVVILFSFNHPPGRFNYVWHKFTFDNWIHWNSVLGIQRRPREVARGRPARHASSPPRSER